MGSDTSLPVLTKICVTLSAMYVYYKLRRRITIVLDLLVVFDRLIYH